VAQRRRKIIVIGRLMGGGQCPICNSNRPFWRYLFEPKYFSTCAARFDATAAQLRNLAKSSAVKEPDRCGKGGATFQGAVSPELSVTSKCRGLTACVPARLVSEGTSASAAFRRGAPTASTPTPHRAVWPWQRVVLGAWMQQCDSLKPPHEDQRPAISACASKALCGAKALVCA
jgi:hypothetical protein